jgi:hypothetical protein
VLVGSANPGHFHLNQHATRSLFRQRVFPNLVLPGFYECCREYACGRHIDDVDSSPNLLVADANRSFVPEGAWGKLVANPGLRGVLLFSARVSGSIRSTASEKAGQCVPVEFRGLARRTPIREGRPASRTERD